MELVSVAMATYNGSRFLRQQLDSILNQTYRGIEVVICDDRSQDNTVDILKEYSKANRNLHYYVNESRLGYIKNFERAIALCAGNYIALSDQDDVWLREKIAVLLEEIGDDLLIHSDAKIINERGEILHSSFSEYSGKRVREVSFGSVLIKNVVTCCTSLFKRALADKAGPFPSVIPHDHWLALMAIDEKSLKYCAKPLSLYRKHEGNLLGAKAKEKDYFMLSDDFKESGYFSKKRDSYYHNRFVRYVTLLNMSEKRLSEKNLRILSDIKEYHISFLTKRIRLKGFYLALKYIRILNQGKSAINMIKKTAIPLFGEGRAKSIPDSEG